jgi:hypothetical protein
LADIRERIITGDPPRHGGRRVKVERKPSKETEKGSINPEIQLQKPPKVEEIKIGIRPENGIFLHFETDADNKLREEIETMAKQFRRTPDQQILWLCQNEINIHAELLKEAAQAGSECG